MIRTFAFIAVPLPAHFLLRARFSSCLLPLPKNTIGDNLIFCIDFYMRQ